MVIRILKSTISICSFLQSTSMDLRSFRFWRFTFSDWPKSGPKLFYFWNQCRKRTDSTKNDSEWCHHQYSLSRYWYLSLSFRWWRHLISLMTSLMKTHEFWWSNDFRKILRLTIVSLVWFSWPTTFNHQLPGWTTSDTTDLINMVRSICGKFFKFVKFWNWGSL